VGAVWSFEASVEARDAAGGTSRRAVREQVAALEAWLREQPGGGGVGGASPGARQE
jgi:hypothetical protein